VAAIFYSSNSMVKSYCFKVILKIYDAVVDVAQSHGIGIRFMD